MDKDEMKTKVSINKLEEEKKSELEAMGIYGETKGSKHQKEESKNIVASMIKVLAVIGGILGAFSSFFMEDFMMIYLIVSIISAIFIYAIGEVIDLLQIIADNTK